MGGKKTCEKEGARKILTFPSVLYLKRQTKPVESSLKLQSSFRGESKFTTVLMSKTFSKSHLKVVISIHRGYNTGDETRNESLQINEI